MATHNSAKTGSGVRVPKRRPGSIRARLLIAFVLVALLTAISITVSSMWVGYVNGSRQVQDRLNSASALKALAIRGWSNDLQNGLLVALNDQMADARISIVLDLARTNGYYQWYNEAVQLRLLQIIQQSGQFDEICLVDTNGVAVLCTGSGQVAEDCQDAPFFQKGLTGPYVEFPFTPLTPQAKGSGEQNSPANAPGEATSGCRFISTASGSPGAVAARPIIGPQGEVLGVIAGRSSAAALTAIVADPTGLGGSGKAYLVNSLSAQFFPSPTNSPAANGHPTGLPHSAGVDAALRNHTEASGIYRGDRGDLVFGVYRWLPDLQVLLAVEQPLAEAFEGILLELAVNVGIALLAILLAVGASFLITRSITRPIVGLADTASEIAAGDLDRTAIVHRDDEIGVLANAFNSMTAQLRDLIAHLEERVHERTRALRAANEVLQRRAVQMETSAQVSREVTSILQIDDLLTRIVQQIQGSFGYFDARIFLVEGEELVLRTSARAEVGDTRLRLGQTSLNTEAVRAVQAIVVNDVVNESRYLREEHATETRSELAIPLRVGERVIGTLDVVSDRPNAFAREDVLVIQSLGDQVAIAIANARLYERSRALAALEERNRLARDLHDSVNQSLYSLNLLFEGWRRFVRAGEIEKVEEYFDRASEISQQALGEMRLLLHELRPTTVEQGGLVGALRRRLEAVERRAGIKARLVAEDPPDTPAPVQDGLYRIAQEALNNVLKHAAASEVTVRLRVEDNQIVLRVSDDGRGFAPESFAAQSGMGVSNMRQRAEEMGGGLTIESEPGKGTTVTAKVNRETVSAGGTK